MQNFNSLFTRIIRNFLDESFEPRVYFEKKKDFLNPSLILPIQEITKDPLAQANAEIFQARYPFVVMIPNKQRDNYELHPLGLRDIFYPRGAWIYEIKVNDVSINPMLSLFEKWPGPYAILFVGDYDLPNSERKIRANIFKFWEDIVYKENQTILNEEQLGGLKWFVDLELSEYRALWDMIPK